MTDWMAADDANEHIANLVKLRDRLVEERRAQVAKTAESDESGAVSDTEFGKLRELALKIEKVKTLLGSEKSAVYVEKSRIESAERHRHLQEQHQARYPDTYRQKAASEQ